VVVKRRQKCTVHPLICTFSVHEKSELSLDLDQAAQFPPQSVQSNRLCKSQAQIWLTRVQTNGTKGTPQAVSDMKISSVIHIRIWD
jgi:hypothetical protein